MTQINNLKRTGQCYICGEFGRVTREHVIPDCFFTNPRPENLLTLPAHKKCNEDLSISDNYTRDILAWLGSEQSLVAKELWRGKVDRSIKGNRKFRRHLAEALTARADKYSAGGTYIGSAPGIRIDRKRFYPTMEKIVRGLHCLCSGSPMPTEAEFQWRVQEPLHGLRKEFLQASRPSLSYPDIFVSRFTLAYSEDRRSIGGVVWWLLFYNAVLIECATILSPAPDPAPKG